MAKPSRFPPQMNPDLTPELIMLKCNQADINIQLELFSSLTIPTLFTSLNSKLISQNLFLTLHKLLRLHNQPTLYLGYFNKTLQS